MEDIKTYEMLVNDDLTDAIFAISLVDRPAIESDYILLSKDEKIQIELKLAKTVDAQRQIVCGPVLIPDIIIPRKGYNITFSADTILKLSENFLINGNQNNVTLEHQVNVTKVKLVESWIVVDPKNDKSTALGMNLPKGTWCVSFKVNDDDLWTEYIKSGTLKGFSVEGKFSQQEIKLSNDNEYDEGVAEYKKAHPYTLDKDLYDICLSVNTSNYTPADLDKLYRWKLGPSHDNCPICLKNNGQVHTLRAWLLIGLPGVPDGTSVAGQLTKYSNSHSKVPFYGTYCETACNCDLVSMSGKAKNPFSFPGTTPKSSSTNPNKTAPEKSIIDILNPFK